MFETFEYDKTVSKLRKFFKDAKNFIEVPTQSRLRFNQSLTGL